jgi:CheY-like chemotaxis protein
MLGVVLSQEGWQVDQAESGTEALEYCRIHDPDIVVLDNMMPGLPGIEVARRLLERGFSAPIVLFSAYLDAELRTECHLLGLVPVDKINWVELVLMCQGLSSRLAPTGGPQLGAADLHLVAQEPDV